MLSAALYEEAVPVLPADDNCSSFLALFFFVVGGAFSLCVHSSDAALGRRWQWQWWCGQWQRQWRRHWRQRASFVPTGRRGLAVSSVPGRVSVRKLRRREGRRRRQTEIPQGTTRRTTGSKQRREEERNSETTTTTAAGRIGIGIGVDSGHKASDRERIAHLCAASAPLWRWRRRLFLLDAVVAFVYEPLEPLESLSPALALALALADCESAAPSLSLSGLVAVPGELLLVRSKLLGLLSPVLPLCLAGRRKLQLQKEKQGRSQLRATTASTATAPTAASAATTAAASTAASTATVEQLCRCSCGCHRRR